MEVRSSNQKNITITNYQLPITNYQLPITNYQLPITNYQLPIIPANHPKVNNPAMLQLLPLGLLV
ncbi:hypothetical protein BC008_42250 [Mastigocoleus testarum BC008]|uniref:Uncharacterized protein n=1 Tax=Mastigocoleus testarum BC008 TaxID=371196 RepID=A0A0V7ZMC6_9CYAN|nr:hypothetical protein BC008_42250 [Mastigocoleus testarum BC008]